jgi:hypothetical protein
MLILGLIGVVVLIFLLNLLTWFIQQGNLTWGRWRSLTETISMIALSVAAVFSVRTAVIASNQLDEARQDKRAWLGPIHASLPIPTQANVPVTGVVSLRNTGREPSFRTQIYYSAETFLEGDLSSRDKEKEFATQCKTKDPPPGLPFGLIYPTTSDTQVYLTRPKISEDKIDTDLIEGRKFLLIHGCVVYQTLNERRYSAFCYFWSKERGPDLALCDEGNDAN